MKRQMIHDTRVLIGVGTLLGAVSVSSATGARAADSSNGWYTPDQAAHGHITFNSFCAECHRPDLRGAMGPALVGDAFLRTWANRPLGDARTLTERKFMEHRAVALA
jgi:mono/diheme cytochrome c family protein